MSVIITIPVPVQTVSAIRNGDFDKAEVCQMVVDAVKNLPGLQISSSSNTTAPPPAGPGRQSLTPPALSTYDPDETSSLGDDDGYTTRATSPPGYTALPSEYEGTVEGSSSSVIREKVTNFKETKFPVNIVHEGRAVYTIPMKNTKTTADLHVEVEQRAGIPMAQQRLKFKGRQLEFEATLHAVGMLLVGRY